MAMEMIGMDKLQEIIGKWGVETFQHTFKHLPAIHAHLKREVDELQHEIETTPKSWGCDQIAEECADVFILLCSIAHVCGFSLREHVGCKMAINRSRMWREPDKDGVIEHVATISPTNNHELQQAEPTDGQSPDARTGPARLVEYRCNKCGCRVMLHATDRNYIESNCPTKGVVCRLDRVR